MISKWIRVDIDGTILLVSEVENSELVKIDLDMTQAEYQSNFFKDLITNRYIYINGALELNPNYVEPYNFESEVQKQINRKVFGDYTIAEFMVETKVEGYLKQILY
jgi:predicted thioredoxin/glutaredoxin